MKSGYRSIACFGIRIARALLVLGAGAAGSCSAVSDRQAPTHIAWHQTNVQVPAHFEASREQDMLVLRPRGVHSLAGTRSRIVIAWLDPSQPDSIPRTACSITGGACRVERLAGATRETVCEVTDGTGIDTSLAFTVGHCRMAHVPVDARYLCYTRLCPQIRDAMLEVMSAFSEDSTITYRAIP